METEGKITRRELERIKQSLKNKIQSYKEEEKLLAQLLYWNRAAIKNQITVLDVEHMVKQMENGEINKLDFPFLLPSKEEKKKRMTDLGNILKASEDHFKIRFETCEKLNTNEIGMLEQRYRLHGFAYELEFYVEFVTTVEKEKRSQIKQLKIKILNTINQELNQFIVRCEKNCDLPGFFDTLCRYSQHFTERRQIINNIREKYKKYSLPYLKGSDALIQFGNEKYSNIQINLIYQINIDQDNKINLYVTMIPKYPNQAHGFDEAKSKILMDLGQNFQSLASLKGVLIATDLTLNAIYNN